MKGGREKDGEKGRERDKEGLKEGRWEIKGAMDVCREREKKTRECICSTTRCYQLAPRNIGFNS